MPEKEPEEDTPVYLEATGNRQNHVIFDGGELLTAETAGVKVKVAALTAEAAHGVLMIVFVNAMPSHLEKNLLAHVSDNYMEKLTLEVETIELALVHGYADELVPV
jgi:hypothetical protein